MRGCSSSPSIDDRQVGRIFAAGPSLMKAYFGAPDETRRVLADDGWLETPSADCMS